MTDLWRHQQQAFDFAKDRDAVMLAMAMRTGKTRVACELLRHWDAQQTLILCPVSVMDVWLRQMRMWIPTIRAVPLSKGTVAQQARFFEEELKRSRGPVAFIKNFDGIWRPPLGELVLNQMWDVVISDECHPAGTLVSTPGGDRRIEDLRVGDEVWSVDHNTGTTAASKVTKTFKRLSSEPLILADHTVMTPHHPVWTLKRGYVPAYSLTCNETVCYIITNDTPRTPKEDPSAYLRVVQKSISRQEANSTILQRPVQKFMDQDTAASKDSFDQLRMVRDVVYVCEEKSAALRNRVSCEVEGKFAGSKEETNTNDETASLQKGCQGKTLETSSFREQPIQEWNCSAKSADCLAGKTNSSVKRTQRRKWTPTSVASAIIGGAIRLANRICDLNQQKISTSKQHQNRYSRATSEDSHRSRWAFSYKQDSQSEGPAERPLLAILRLDCVEIIEQGSIREARPRSYRSYESREVFNIETTVGNYFANRLLVHNSHRHGCHNSKISKFMMKMHGRARRRLCLTGTPMSRSPLSIFGQYRFLDPRLFGWRWGNFLYSFAERNNPMIPQMITGFRNLDILQERFGRIAFQVDNSVLDLPPEQHDSRTFDLPYKAAKIYRDLERDFVADLDSGVITVANALVKTLRLRQVVSGYLCPDESDKPETLHVERATILRDILEDAGQEVVVFCEFVNDLKMVRLACDELSLRYGEVSGRRKDLGEGGTFPENVDVLGVQYQSGGLGIDLSKARICVIYTPCWSLSNYEQALARLRKPGLPGFIVYHLVARGTVDDQVYKSLREKKNVIESVLEGLRLRQGEEQWSR